METTNSFRESLTVEQFKSATGVQSISIVRNPKNNNLFFTFGSKSGAISDSIKEEIEKGKITSQVMLSLTTSDSGEDLWILHKKATSNVVLEF